MKNNTWIITADVEKVYDVFGAFNRFDSIWWHMSLRGCFSFCDIFNGFSAIFKICFVCSKF